MGQNEVSLDFFLNVVPAFTKWIMTEWEFDSRHSVLQVMISYRHNSSILLVDQFSSVAHLVITHYDSAYSHNCTGLDFFLVGLPYDIIVRCYQLTAEIEYKLESKKGACMQKVLAHVTHDRAMNPAFR